MGNIGLISRCRSLGLPQHRLAEFCKRTVAVGACAVPVKYAVAASALAYGVDLQFHTELFTSLKRILVRETPGRLEHNHIAGCKGCFLYILRSSRETASVPFLRDVYIKLLKICPRLLAGTRRLSVRSKPVLASVRIAAGYAAGYNAGGIGFVNEQFYGASFVVAARGTVCGNIFFPDLRVDIQSVPVPEEFRPAEGPFIFRYV